MRILLAEDDPMLGPLIALSLQEAGYAVDSVIDGNSALQAALSGAYEVILLDLGLPRLDGMAVLEQVQRRDAGAVIIISARDALGSRLAGLDGGADDYLVKPFEMSELLARIRAVMRRGRERDDILRLGRLSLDTRRMQAAFDSGETIELTAKEFALLHILMRGAGRIFSRSQLEEKLYGWDAEIDSNAVDFLIHGLRKKLGKAAVKNIRGAGWMMPKGGSDA